MQSVRQYRRIRSAVEAQVVAGRIDNSAADTHSVFDNPDHNASDVSISKESWSSSDADEDTIIVGWQGPDDPLNPRNWTLQRRAVIFAILWINVFAVDWASSADSQAGGTISKVFHVSEEAEALSPSLYTFGLAAGSLLAGPIAETVGRNPVYVVSRCFHVVWLVGAALAPNFGAQCVFRLFAGFSGSILLAIHAASIADIYGPVYRTIAWPIIALASFWGTAASPVVGAWISQTGVDWRWTEWIAVLLSGSTLFLTLFFLPETFSPILLSWRAKHLRDLTGSNRFKAELELKDSLLKRLQTAFLRAFHMITREPTVMLLGGWLVGEYLVVFGFLQGFTYIFGDTYNFSRGYIGTSFAALGLGCTLWTCGIPVYYYLYKRKVGRLHLSISGERNVSLVTKAALPGQDLPDPEYRLWTAVLAAPAFPISLFWLGWTNYASVSYWSSEGAVVLLGFSWAGIYVTVALAVVTCCRYLASGFINLVSRPMYDGIGVHWTMTLLGCLAVLQMPLPLIFYRYGQAVRKRSAFAGRYERNGYDTTVSLVCQKIVTPTRSELSNFSVSDQRLVHLSRVRFPPSNKT
nr:putative efflux pump kojt [Quercus suber]